MRLMGMVVVVVAPSPSCVDHHAFLFIMSCFQALDTIFFLKRSFCACRMLQHHHDRFVEVSSEGHRCNLTAIDFIGRQRELWVFEAAASDKS